MADRKFGFDTLCLHAGQIPDAATGARALPIYQTTSFVFDSADHAASLFNLQTFGNVYSRISNPTVAALEERVAALEGGRAALAAATGMAAQMVALLTLARNGEHIVAARTLYGGTYSQLATTFAQFGIDATFVDADDPAAFRTALGRRRRPVYAETIGNPQLNVCDIAALADVAHGAAFRSSSTTRSLRLSCAARSSTAPTSSSFGDEVPRRPRTTMGGILVESGKFPWDNGNFPADDGSLARLSRRRFYETFGDFGFTMKARMETMRTLGPTLAPLRHSAAAGASRRCICGCRGTATRRSPLHAILPATERSNGSTIRCSKAIATRRSRSGICHAVRAGYSRSACAAERRPASASSSRCRFLSHLANVGDAKSLVIHPASTTHRQLSEDEQRAAGVTPR
jgi:O-acetylhomoserine (thiol)-lyase